MENKTASFVSDAFTFESAEPLAGAFLRALVTPAFVWESGDGRIVSANRLAVEMFRRFREDSSFLGDYVRNWTKVRSFAFDIMWFEFITPDDRVFPVQVRNSALDEDAGRIVSVVVNAQWAGNRSIDQSIDGLTGLIRTASTTFLSRKDFIDNFETFILRTTVALNLASFNFYPSASLKSYGLFDVAERLAKKENAYKVYSPYLDRFDRLKSGTLSRLQDMAEEIPDTYLAFPLVNGSETVGWFVIVLYDNREYAQETLQTVFEVFATFFQSLIDKVTMTKALYQSDFENRLNIRIVENVREGIVITNQQLQIAYLNAISGQMFGFKPDDIFGHQLEDLLVSNVSIRKFVDSFPADGEDFVETPSVQYLHRRSGERFPCRIRFSKVSLTEENQYYVFVLTDVTETEESRLKTEQLTQRAILGDFASMMAHEIRNPVNNINTWVQNIKANSEKRSPIYSAATRIESDCQRVSDTISNILAFSRPLKLNPELTDFGILIDVILERWKRDFAVENIQCYFRKPDDFPKLLIDVKSMDQVITNLVQNAVDAIDHAGGTISLRLSTQPSGIPGRNVAMLSVANTGPGIPDELIDHIFEPFITSKKNGNGWGLAVTKRIITTHRGTIQVKSLSEGVVFEILLPIPDGG